jgi:hypothetical protein
MLKHPKKLRALSPAPNANVISKDVPSAEKKPTLSSSNNVAIAVGS